MSNVTPIRNYSDELSNDERTWFTLPEVCTLAGITPRQADYWTRTGLLVPTGSTAPGSGNYRRYSTAELDKAKAIKALLDAGLNLAELREHVDQLILTGHLVVGPVTITYSATENPA